jgi:hypothetical protein
MFEVVVDGNAIGGRTGFPEIKKFVIKNGRNATMSVRVITPVDRTRVVLVVTRSIGISVSANNSPSIE